MRLHNFCVDRRETDWKVNDLSPDLIMEHVALYEESLLYPYVSRTGYQ